MKRGSVMLTTFAKVKDFLEKQVETFYEAIREIKNNCDVLFRFFSLKYSNTSIKGNCFIFILKKRKFFPI